ncbi:MAG: glucose-1-phosphate adenylyltransferase [Eubacterium sp.]|nr:glucose-1-phosphate adenylyltransferase [Eubacterium sp.]MCM1417358.1 glucose-1-phosphate adenylyltransferase [Roseburia sp.]
MNHVKKECVAMLLAGGQGSRLYALTQNMAKPAVPYGGKYRIIDFPLSNCVNSGIDTVGVLTQYQPLVLNEYIGNGHPWGLDRVHGGVHVLPPYETASGKSWYTGTANAIYQNISFIDRYNPEYVAVLSGDHIYKMDYSKMLDYHKKKNADATIAVLEVPWEEAPRFGIMTADEEGTITEFAEKPKEPKSNLASMGVYIFTWSTLKRHLIANEQDEGATKDFGKNIIPAMLGEGSKLVAYHFDAYWKDVGTIDSLWEANMDCLDPNVPLDLYDPKWKIYSRNPVMPPHYVGADSKIENSMVAEGCEINGDVDFSVLFAGVTIEEGATVRYSIVMPNTVIKKGSVIEFSIVGEDCVIGEDVHLGERPENVENRDEWGVAVIGPGVTVSDHQKIAPKAMISADL